MTSVNQVGQVSPFLITDRAKLNIAMSKGAAMTTDIDRKPAVVHMFFKKRARAVCHSSRHVVGYAKFCHENQSDPTI